MKKLSIKAEELYAKVVEGLGGVEAIDKHGQKSIQLQNEIGCRRGETVPWRHDFIIHHLGLDGLIDVGKNIVKPIFDSVVEKIANKFGATALIPEVKGVERAGIKVRTRYGGDGCNHCHQRDFT